MSDQPEDLTALGLGELGSRLVNALGNFERSKERLEDVEKKIEEFRGDITRILEHLRPIKDEMLKRLNAIEFLDPVDVTPDAPIEDTDHVVGEQPTG